MLMPVSVGGLGQCVLHTIRESCREPPSLRRVRESQLGITQVIQVGLQLLPHRRLCTYSVDVVVRMWLYMVCQIALASCVVYSIGCRTCPLCK